MSGMSSTLNSTSTTGPITRATRPVPGAPVSEVVSATAVMSSLTPGGGIGQRVGAADNLADLLGDLSLAGRIGLDRVALDELGGVVGRRLHRPPARGQLGRRRLQQGVVDPALDVARQQRVEDLLGRWLELVERQRASLGLLLGLLDLERQQPPGHGLL